MNDIIKGFNSIQKKTYSYLLWYMIIIIFSVFMLFRIISILSNYNERGGFFYVQLLNYSLPVVEIETYDEATYAENEMSIKNVVSETLGLDKITTLKILQNEIGIFNVLDLNTVSNITNTGEQIASIEPFEISDSSITKYSEEEIAANTSPYDESLSSSTLSSVPEVLIYHTHTHEGYSEAGVSTEDENYNVVGVGDVITDELQNSYGIWTIHDKTMHDLSYNESYKNSATTVQNYLDQYGSFKLVIDIHRDSCESKSAVTVNINGEDLARIEFVTAENSTYYNENMQVVNSLIGISDNLFPGLLRDDPIYEYTRGSNAFNQSLSPNAILIEVGSIANSSTETQATGKYIARIIAEYINSLN